MPNFYETFSNGIGQLNHTWGQYDTSVAGQVTVKGAFSGIMQRPSGPSAGNGYGHYEITASLHGDTAGPAILLWPGDDKWPGQEIDLAEIWQGAPYAAAHHKTATGGDGYRTVNYTGLDESKPHKYTLDWTPGKLVFGVDGRTVGTIDKNVAPDFEHGGVDLVFSIMNGNANTSTTVYDVSYTDTYPGPVAPTPTPPAPTPTPTGPDKSGASSMEHYFLQLVNASRAAVGAKALGFDAELVKAAGAHSDWMVRTDVFSHTGAGGSSAGDRMKAAGYGASGWGENIAYISGSGAAVLDQADVRQLHTNLMNSPGHKANILNPNFTEIGIGLTQGDYKGRPAIFVTEDFGRPNSAEALESDGWFI